MILKNIIIPQNWELLKLSEVGKVIGGGTPDTKIAEYWEGEIYWATPTEITTLNGKYILSTMRRITRLGLEKSGAKLLPSNSLLLTSRASIGYCAINKNQICTNQGFQNIVPNERIKVDFLYYMMQSHLAQRQLTRIAYGSTFKEVPNKGMKKIKILVPSIPEQQKITFYLSNLDDIIILTQKIIDHLQTLKKGLMQRLFTEGIGHTEFKRIKFIGKVPKIWNISRLSKITNQIKDGTHWTPEYIESGIPFLRIGDIKEQKINWDSVKKISKEKHQELINRCKPEYGDVLLSKNGTVGITMVVDWDIEFSLYVSLCLIKPKHDIINKKYLAYFLTSGGMKQINYRSKTATVKNLHLEEIRELLIPLPSISEQRQIAEILGEVDKKIEAENNILIKYKKIKKGLMQDLLTGRKRIKIN